MTIILQIEKGSRFTLWNVVKVSIDESGAIVTHTDREPTQIQGFVASLKRKG